MKISAVYKITNTVTGDFYIGSSKNVKRRWIEHKCQSIWNEYPNSQLYKDMKQYGVEKFEFQILAEIEPEKLKEVEQQFIEKLQPTYNQMNAKGWDIERIKETNKKASRKREKTEKYKEYQREYRKSEKYKEAHRKASKEYNNQLCCYNGEILTLCALVTRFSRAGIEHPTAEAKKYLLNK